ncbi:MAG: DUF551 domain-containing protein [Agathobacter sp.]|nr:DUF551 domain-containing protein [Agathobacter sp.]
MQEVFEKIIEKLKEISIFMTTCDGYGANCVSVGTIEEIVKQEAEKHNNGWIPCSERFPEESLNDVIGWDAYRERCCFVHYIGGRFILGDDTESVKITHWMPTPYQPKGE